MRLGSPVKAFTSSLPLRLWWLNHRAKLATLRGATRIATRIAGRPLTDEEKYPR